MGAILDALPVSVAIIGQDGQIRAINKAWTASDHGINVFHVIVGLDYPSIYKEVGGDGSAIIDGISSVLDGRAAEYTHVHSCNGIVAHGNSRISICVRPIELPGSPRLAIVTHTELPDDQFVGFLSDEWSHELRAPLTPVLASVSDLLRNCPQLMGTDVCEALEVIRRNTELEAKLVDDMLTLTRLQVGKLVLHQESVDVHELIRRVINQFQPELEKNKINLIVALDAAEAIAWADPDCLNQTLINLFSNALKFTPAGGRAAVRTERIGTRFQIEISDSGVGIESDMLERLFNPFQHGKPTTKRSIGGLGLSIAKQLIDLHGGSLTAHSDGAGCGATFTIDLMAGPLPVSVHPPLATAAVHVPVPVDAPAKEKLRVLLIDDHKDTVLTLARLMRHMGYAVDTATCVAEAIDKLQTDDQYDLLLSDIGLPDGTGLEVVREFRRRNELKRAVALSGFGQPDDIRRSLEAGFNEHLVKPITVEQLDEVLRIAC